MKLRSLDFWNIFYYRKSKVLKKVHLGTGTKFQVPVPVLVKIWTVLKPSAEQVKVSTLLCMPVEVCFWDMNLAAGGLAWWRFLYCAQTERPERRTERSLPHAVLCSLGHGTTAVPAEIRVTHTVSSFMFRVCGGQDSFSLLTEHSSWLKTHRGPPQEMGILTADRNSRTGQQHCGQMD